MVRAYILAHDGYRSEASALVSGLVPTSTPLEARELTNLAAMLDRRSNTTGSFAAHSIANAVSSVEPTRELDVRVMPNPARSRASVSVLLDAPMRTRIGVYDVLGREVAVLVSGDLPAGRTSFDLNTGYLPAGSYVVRAILDSTAGRGRTLVRRLTVVRP
jgi:hypothetical protein